MEISNPCHGCTKADTVDYSPSQLAVKVTTECTAQVYLSVCTNDFQWIRCSFDVLIWLPFPYYIAHIHCPRSLIKDAHSSYLAVLYFCDNVPSPLFSSFDYFRDVHCIWYDCDVILFGYVRLVEQWNTSLDWLYLNIPGTKLQLVSGLAIQILTGIFITNCELFSYLLTNLLTWCCIVCWTFSMCMTHYYRCDVYWLCSGHVLTEDTSSQNVITGRLYTKRLLTKTNHLPRWGERFVPGPRQVCIIEESIVDPKTQTLTTYTRNIGYTTIMVTMAWSFPLFVMLRCFYFILSTATLFSNVQNEHCEQKTNRRDICGYINVIMLLLWYLYRFIQKTCISV